MSVNEATNSVRFRYSLLTDYKNASDIALTGYALLVLFQLNGKLNGLDLSPTGIYTLS
jgi:hypothetical protein